MSLVTLKELVPEDLKSFVTQDLQNKLDALEKDPTMREYIENNMISYAGVLKDSNIKNLDNYLHAVAYCTHKLKGDNRIECYAKTFPTKYASLVGSGASSKTIEKYAIAYENTKLVGTLLEQSIIPSWILNQDIYQKAINAQVALMLSAKSEKVRCDAANSLLNALARPKEVAPLVHINMGSSSELDALRKALVDVSVNQQSRIISGTPTKQIADEDIINGCD